MKKRLLNIELLRIFAMLLITFWHVIGHYADYLPKEEYHIGIAMSYVSLFIAFHVDLFILITGYFGINCRKKSFIRTLTLCVFYAIILNLVSWGCGNSFNWNEIIFPLSRSPWWFLKVYFILVLVAPVIERYISNSNERDFYILLGILGFIDVYLSFCLNDSFYDNHGYDIFNFVFVYLLGCWLRRNDKIITVFKENAWVTILVILLCFIIRYKVQTINITWNDYNCPINLTLALCVFCLFLKLKVSPGLYKPILFFSSSSVAAYIIMDYEHLRNQFAVPFVRVMSMCNGKISQTIMIVSFTIIAYVLCCCADKLRIPVTSIADKYILKLVDVCQKHWMQK